MTPDQRVAIVTGGSSGIGRATAVALGKRRKGQGCGSNRREKRGGKQSTIKTLEVTHLFKTD